MTTNFEKLSELNESLQSEIAKSAKSNAAEMGQRGIISDLGLAMLEVSMAVDRKKFQDIPPCLDKLQKQLGNEAVNSGHNFDSANKIISEMKGVLGIDEQKHAKPKFERKEAVKADLDKWVKSVAKGKDDPSMKR